MSLSFVDDKVHEGTNLDSVIANAFVKGDSNISFSLQGNDSSDFKVQENGKITVANELNFDQKDTYDLTLVVKGTQVTQWKFH